LDIETFFRLLGYGTFYLVESNLRFILSAGLSWTLNFVLHWTNLISNQQLVNFSWQIGLLWIFPENYLVCHLTIELLL